MSSNKKNPNKYAKRTPTGTTQRYRGPKGDEEALGYNVFDYGRANNQNQYNKTLEVPWPVCETKDKLLLIKNCEI